MSTVFASVAVICAVALTNSVALAESAGTPIEAEPLILPSPQAARNVTHADRVDPQVPDATAVAPTAEPVAAPAPITVTVPPATPTHTTAQDAVEVAEQTGTWTPVEEWANNQGWSKGRIDAWIKRLEDERGAQGNGEQGRDSSNESGDRLTTSDSDQKTSVKADTSAERQTVESDLGSKKTQSRVSPDRRD